MLQGMDGALSGARPYPLKKVGETVFDPRGRGGVGCFLSNG